MMRFTFPADDGTGDTIEVELTDDQAQPGRAIAYFAGDGQLLANEDGTLTLVESIADDPRDTP